MTPSVLTLMCAILHELLPSLFGCILAVLGYNSSLMLLGQHWYELRGMPGMLPRQTRWTLAGSQRQLQTSWC